jgi:hypothetical protein
MSDIQTEGVSFPNRFYAKFIPPVKIMDVIQDQGTEGPTSFDMEHFALRADMAELPGYTWNTTESRTFGKVWRRPTQAVYSDLNLSFICSANMVERYLFDYWFHVIRDTSFMYEYHDDICTDIEVTLFTQNYESVYGIKFIRAWPIAVSPVQLNWADQDIIRLNVTFAYERWDTVAYPPPNFAQPSFAGQSPFAAFTSSFLQQFTSSLAARLPGFIPTLSGFGTADVIRAGTNLLGGGTTTLGDAISRTIPRIF